MGEAMEQKAPLGPQVDVVVGAGSLDAVLLAVVAGRRLRTGRSGSRPLGRAA